jgi:hypothetical protein
MKYIPGTHIPLTEWKQLTAQGNTLCALDEHNAALRAPARVPTIDEYLAVFERAAVLGEARVGAEQKEELKKTVFRIRNGFQNFYSPSVSFEVGRPKSVGYGWRMSIYRVENPRTNMSGQPREDLIDITVTHTPSARVVVDTRNVLWGDAEKQVMGIMNKALPRVVRKQGLRGGGMVYMMPQGHSWLEENA